MTDVLAIGAHPDDVELGMGGTIRKMVKQGYSVGVVDLTDGEPTPDGSPEIRAKESEKAREVLGFDFRITLDMKNRYLFDSVENRKKVANIIREYKPKMLFTHFWDDYHPDHIQTSQIVQAARFYGKFTKTDMVGEPHTVEKLYFFGPIHLLSNLRPSFIVPLEDDEMQSKIKALRCYRSQFGREGEAFYDRIRQYMVCYGLLIKKSYGEPFISKEEIGIENLGDIT